MEPVVENNAVVDEFINTVGQTPETIIPEPEVKVEEPKAEPEVKSEEVEAVTTAPLSVVKELREEKRSLRQQLETEKINAARLQGRLEALAEVAEKSKPAPVQEESPLDKFAKEYPGESVPVEVQLAQRAWDANRVSAQETHVKTQTLQQQIETGIAKAKEMLSPDKVGEGLDLDSVVGLARQNNLITQAEQNYAATQGVRAAETLYFLSLNKIRQVGGVPLQELNRRLLSRHDAVLAKKNGTKPTINNLPASTNEEEQADINGITAFMFR